MAMPLKVKHTDHDQKLRDLARDIVTQIRDASEVLHERGITETEYAQLAETAYFQTMLRQAQSEWEGVGNTQQRVRLKSAALVEEALPEMFCELSNRDEPLSSRVALLQTLAKIGDLGQQSAAQPGKGNTFKLSINLNGNHESPKTITIESNVVSEEVEADPNDELSAGVMELQDA